MFHENTFTFATIASNSSKEGVNRLFYMDGTRMCEGENGLVPQQIIRETHQAEGETLRTMGHPSEQVQPTMEEESAETWHIEGPKEIQPIELQGTEFGLQENQPNMPQHIPADQGR